MKVLQQQGSASILYVQSLQSAGVETGQDTTTRKGLARYCSPLNSRSRPATKAHPPNSDEIQTSPACLSVSTR